MVRNQQSTSFIQNVLTELYTPTTHHDHHQRRTQGTA